MMDPSNINSFEDQWRKALQEASETPPASVWESIEARLDKEQEKVIPLWWRSPRIWYAAASLAALMLVGGGLWLLDKPNEKERIAVTKQPAQTPGKTDASEKEQPGLSGDNESIPASGETKSESVAAMTGDQEKRTEKIVAREGNVSVPAPQNGFTNKTERELASVTGKVVEKTLIQTGKAVSGQEGLPVSDSQSATTETIASAKLAGENSMTTGAGHESQSISAQLLASLPYSDLDVYVQKRHVFFRPEIKIEEPVKPKKQTEYYAGIGVMPASFNPDVQVKEAPTAFLAQSVSQRRAVTGSSQARASYAVQTQGGVRISKHWSVETGLSYLRGNSAYEGGGYVLNPSNSAAANVLENALAGLPNSANSPAFADKSSNFNSGALYIDVAKKVSNNYQYLQMPVQAGFTLNPEKKFSYSVLGGMMANFFLVNELESASGDIIKTTASDNIYRGMNWAATTGLRFNYKLSSNWAANLTGSYQKAVSSGFKSNQSLDSHPYLYGVSWSVRYSF